MSEEKFQRARQLANSGQFDEARAILRTVRGQKAKDWLEKIDVMDPLGAPPKKKDTTASGCVTAIFVVIILYAVFSPRGGSGSSSSAQPTARPKAPTEYVSINRDELISYAQRYIGDGVRVTGTVISVFGDYELQIRLDGGGSYFVIIEARQALEGIHEGDLVDVYGTVAGYAEGENAFGGDIRLPLLIDAVIYEF
jgi:hypothetical protein